MMQQQKHLSLHFTQPAPSKLQILQMHIRSFVEIEKTMWFNVLKAFPDHQPLANIRPSDCPQTICDSLSDKLS